MLQRVMHLSGDIGAHSLHSASKVWSISAKSLCSDVFLDVDVTALIYYSPFFDGALTGRSERLGEKDLKGDIPVMTRVIKL